MAVPIAVLGLCPSIHAVTILLPNGNFNSPMLTHSVTNDFADETSLDQGWYSRDADDGVRVPPAEFDYSAGATPALGGAAGVLTLLSVDNTHTRFGQFFTKPSELVGSGWSLRLDVGGPDASSGFTRLDIWGGNLAGSPSGTAVNVGNNNAPADTLSDTGWTTLLNLDGVFGPGAGLEFPIAADLTSYDVLVIKVRNTRSQSQVGTTFDNFAFVNPIPEPSTGLLALLGGCSLILGRRRR